LLHSVGDLMYECWTSESHLKATQRS